MLDTNNVSKDTISQPPCVYCDEPMRPVLSDRLHTSKELVHFFCEGCGWEVVVPLR